MTEPYDTPDDGSVFSENYPFTGQPVYRESRRVRRLAAGLLLLGFGFGIGALLVALALQVRP